MTVDVGERLRCPECGAAIDLERLLTDGDMWPREWDRAMRLLASAYVDCFRVRPGARLSAKKRLRLSLELADIWRQGGITYDGREYRTATADLRAALQIVANREMTGMSNHNYLKKVLIGLVERRRAAGPAPAAPAPGKYARSGRQVVEIGDD